MKHRIHIFGASGSGTTTLGRELSGHLPHEVLDADDYFWSVKYSVPTPPAERLRLLKHDLSMKQDWILTGAVCGWGDGLRPCFDLVVYLYVPTDIRLQRLADRELLRYGDEIKPGGLKYEDTKSFLEWAAQYDTGGLEIRSRALHEQWMSGLSCPVLRLEGTESVQERVKLVLDAI
jgi:adenylate kinase family enzyme